jgi:DNA-binding LacI/PurR family transcriptional regulator
MPTMNDVAARAQVSVASVSRALSGTGRPVSEAVRLRVLRAAEELGYQPNALARNMRTGSARTLGLIISDVTNPFFTAIARSCEDVAQSESYSLVLSNTDEKPEREETSLAVMAGERVAAVMLASTNQAQDAIARLEAVRIPVVAIDRRIDGFVTDAVLVDNDGIGYQATSHLLRHGHTDIAVITGPPEISSTRERLAGYRRALADHGVRESMELIRAGDLRERGGYTAATALLDGPKRPTAFVSSNNLTTIGLLHAIRARGLRIPDDVSIIGVDDMPTADLLDPPLTVVEQPTYQLGARAAELAIRRINNPDTPIQQVILGGQLLVRSSTAAPAAP